MTDRSRFAQGAPSLIGGPCHLHSRKRPFLVRVIEPATFPKIAGRMDRGHLGTAILVKRDSIDGTCDVNPVRHKRLVWSER